MPLAPDAHYKTWCQRFGVYAILVAMNLQTSFLTPPFGFSLFYLKGVAPSEVRTIDIYYGVMPFIILQMIVLGILVLFPQWFGFSAH